MMFLNHYLPIATVVVAGALHAQAKAVFAHFIIGNSASSTSADWNDDINKAKAAGIDGFALNIAPGVSYTNTQLTNAYQAANAIGGFSLFLSFDYLATGPWASGDIVNTINTYAGNPSQYRYNNQPLVSTFEGTNNIGDWSGIKSATGCFFIPDWTSLGPLGFQNQLGTADGAFSWDAWPQYPNAEVQSDQAWISALGGKPYMMGVPPWFYTNLPGKNWLWPSNDLWYNRWQQAIQYQPELVEIISWNDYGESHYIGPIRSPGIPSGAARYVDNMPHDNWRDLLPFYIAAYKNDNTSLPAIASEKLIYYYRLNPASSCSDGGTTGNSAPDGQTTYPAAQAEPDVIGLDVLVQSPADVQVQIGGGATTNLRAMNAEVNHFDIPFNGQVGAVTFTVSRNGQVVLGTTGPAITTNCVDGLVNWNAYVGGSG